MQQRFRFIHWMVNQNARRQADKAEHERLKRYYLNKLRGPSEQPKPTPLELSEVGR